MSHFSIMPLAFSQALEDYCVMFIATLFEFLVKNLKDWSLYGEEKSKVLLKCYSLYSLFHSASITKFIVELVQKSLFNPNISLQTNVCEKFVKSNPKRRTKEHFDLKGNWAKAIKNILLGWLGLRPQTLVIGRSV